MRCYSEEYFPTVILRSAATKNLFSPPGALGEILRSAQNDRWEKGMRHFLRQVVSSATPKDSPQILLDNRIAAEMAEDCFYLSRLDIMDLHFAYVQ